MSSQIFGFLDEAREQWVPVSSACLEYAGGLFGLCDGVWAFV